MEDIWGEYSMVKCVLSDMSITQNMTVLTRFPMLV